MIKMVAIFGTIGLLVTSCGFPPIPTTKIDQVKRNRIFKECLTDVPVGPIATQYNDWAEVVSSCDTIAYHQSLICVTNCETSTLVQSSPETMEKN